MRIALPMRRYHKMRRDGPQNKRFSSRACDECGRAFRARQTHYSRQVKSQDEVSRRRIAPWVAGFSALARTYTD